MRCTKPQEPELACSPPNLGEVHAELETVCVALPLDGTAGQVRVLAKWWHRAKLHSTEPPQLCMEPKPHTELVAARRGSWCRSSDDTRCTLPSTTLMARSTGEQRM
eukprot:scaffold60600_cov68-Phaeocystis_antarctica.AAC.3